MDYETKGLQLPSTTVRRPILSRVDHAGAIDEVDEHYRRAVSAGFDGIELMLAPEGVWPHTDGASRCTLRAWAVAARCTRSNVAAALEEVTSLLTRAGTLQARCLNLTIPPLTATPGDEGFGSYRDALNFAYKLLEGVRFEAEAAGVAVALEAGAGHTLLSPVELCEIIDAANSWAVGACIDVATVARLGAPADWIRTLARRVCTVRIHALPAAQVARLCGVESPPPGGHEALVGSAWPPDRTQVTQPETQTAWQPLGVSAVAGALDEVGYVGPLVAVGRVPAEELKMQLGWHL